MNCLPKILYIDDERENLVGFEICFGKNYCVYTAEDTKTGYELLKSIEFSVVMVDYKMPLEDGITFIERIKNEFRNVVFIVITGYADLETVIKAINMNCFHSFVQKPWNTGELKISLNNAVEIYESKKENRILLEKLVLKNKQLEESIDREMKLNNLKDLLLQNISHELRTPLHNIIGFANLAYKELENSDQKNYVVNCINGSYRLLKIVDDIFATSLIMTNQFKISIEDFNLRNLVDELIYVRQLRGSNESSVDLKIDIDDDFQLRNDKDKIQMVIDALIDNAQKFTHSGFVQISAQKNGTGELIVTVADTGIGIDEEIQPYIFQPFSQGDNSSTRDYCGNGLGLYIAKSFVEKLEGKFWFESEVNKGSKFSFTIKNMQYHMVQV